MGFLRLLTAPFRMVGRLLFPMFAAPTPDQPGGGRARRVLLGIVHVLIVALILVGLWYLGRWLQLDRHIRVSSVYLREFWLPVLFLLFYVLCWLARALWKLLGPEQLATDHPDIDRAWEEGLTGLAEAGVGLTEAPLFLVLGRPAGTERSLFNAGGLRLAVKQVPRRADAPVALSANSDVIFVTAAGASLLGRYAGLLHGLGDGEEAEAGEPAAAESSADAEAEVPIPDLAAAPGFGAIGSGPGAAAAVATPQAAAAAPAATTVERSQTLLLRDAEAVERLTERLGHLCTLIGRARRPFTPLNGVLLVIPSAAGGSDAAAREVASLCQRDLEVVRDRLQLECPIAALVCDLEQVPGFTDFVAFFPEGQRKRFLGLQFPLVPDLDPAGKVRMVERGVQWVADVQFPSLIYKNWTPEAAGPAELPPASSSNARLYRFLGELRERQKRIARVLTRGIVMPTGGRAMLGACGFAATGRDLVREQGFASAAFRWLVENQNHVAWTPEAVAVDSEFRRGARLGYLGLLALVAGLAAVAYALWPGRIF